MERRRFFQLFAIGAASIPQIAINAAAPTFTARADHYIKGLQDGFLSVNDIRNLEGLDPIEHDFDESVWRRANPGLDI
jgi:hypothetical protein